MYSESGTILGTPWTTTTHPTPWMEIGKRGLGQHGPIELTGMVSLLMDIPSHSQCSGSLASLRDLSD